MSASSEKDQITLNDFSGDFDVVAWVNNSLLARSSNGCDKQASTLRSQLQHLQSELNTSVEDLSARAALRIPRVSRDVDAIKSEVEILRDHLQQLEQEVRGSDPSVDEVRKLDQVKVRVEESHHMLTEAARFDTLLASLAISKKKASSENSSLSRATDLEKRVELIQELQESHRGLPKLTRFEEGRNAADALIAELEATLAGEFQQCVRENDTAGCVRLFKIYKKISIEKQCEQHYRSVKQKQFEELWAKFCGKSVSVSSISKFFDELLLVVHSELKWTESLFPSAGTVLSVYADAIAAIVPSLSQYYTTLPLPGVSEQFHASKIFSDRLELEPAIKTARKELLRLQSNTFRPFVGIHNSFSALARTHLESQSPTRRKDRSVVALDLDSTDPNSIVTLLQKSLPIFLSQLGEVVQLCVRVSSGSEIPAVLVLLEDLCDEYFSSIADGLGMMKRLIELDAPGESVTLSPQQQRLHQQQQQHQQQSKWREEQFQLSLRVLTLLSGEFVASFKQFERQIRGTIVAQTELLFPTGSKNIVSLEDVKCYHLSSLPVARKLAATLFTFQNASMLTIPHAIRRLDTLTTQAQALVFSSMLVPIKHTLQQVSRLPGWAVPSTSFPPKFSLSPQDYVKMVVDHMLVLRQQLEPFDSNSSFSIKAGETDSWHHFQQGAVDHLEGFASMWMLAVAQTTMTQYVSRIIEIANLTPHGCTQLAVDILHLQNVLKVLDVQPIPALALVLELIQTESQDDFRQRVSSSGKGESRYLVSALANARGFSLSD
eukprot:TRINITY_DN10842_c0_g1_i1.p1 TRINITY_DN10842_c0_g1~~TRINITY_DN10842_c0_g1_i1.p1  ORF type:complete len:817 (+),score=148.10 TRINITY_DN10842_c0_g1_i1:128-2452(+)